MLDEVYLKHGPHHQERLGTVAQNLKEKFSTPNLFDQDIQIELNSWADRNQPAIMTSLEQIYADGQQLRSVQSPGHDLAHLLDNLNSALRIFNEYGDFSEVEKLEVILGCLGHDLGRYAEKALDKIDPKDTLFLTPALIGRNLLRRLNLPEPLQLRILYDIASGSVPKTGYRTADVLHQCDREYLTGSGTVARDLAFDVVLSNRELMIPTNEQLASRLPIPESPGDQWFLVQMEFFMRNVYPPVSPDGEATIRAIKEDNAVILMLATEGKEAEFKQVFAPELGSLSGHWSKKPIPVEIFEAAQKKKDRFLSELSLVNTNGSTLDLIKALMASDKISSPQNFDRVMTEKLGHCTNQERSNLWMIATYALLERHKQRLNDLQKLEEYQQSGGISAVVAGWLVEEFRSREKIYFASPHYVSFNY